MPHKSGYGSKGNRRGTGKNSGTFMKGSATGKVATGKKIGMEEQKISTRGRSSGNSMKMYSS